MKILSGNDSFSAGLTTVIDGNARQVLEKFNNPSEQAKITEMLQNGKISE